MLNDGFRVRSAEQSDGLELARLRWDFTLEDHADEAIESRRTFTERFTERWTSFCESGRWFVAVAEHVAIDGRLLGCVWLETVDRVPRPIPHADEMGYITNVYVEPAWRNHGIGTDLLRVVVSQAQSRGFGELFVWPSDASVEFYKRVGFSVSHEVHEMSLNGPDSN